MVYVRNKDGSYNKDLFLNITAKTQPYIPEAPIETKATALSSEVSIFLSCLCVYLISAERIFCQGKEFSLL